MGSQTLPKLPTIDLTTESLKHGTRSWVARCNDVRHALEEYGCFVAVCDNKYSLEIKDKVLKALEELFDLPIETKVKNTSERPLFGYAGQEPSIPLYESLGMDNADTLEGIQNFTNVLWPNGNTSFGEAVYPFSKLVLELEQLVKRMVFESYGVEKYYDSHNAKSTAYLLRVMKYRSPNMNETNIGAREHTDKSFITILHQNQVSGLEVMTKDGEWIGFDPQPLSFIVMAGDAFLAWSNNRIHSPSHRVVMRGNEERYSLGMFTFNKGMIGIPEELVDDEHPLKFKPFDHFGMFTSYASRFPNLGDWSINAYCGV